MLTSLRWAALVLSSAAAVSRAQGPGGGRGWGPDTLPVQHAVHGSTVRVDEGRLQPPVTGARVRLVHVLADDRRSELMIIYAESSSGVGALSPAELAGLIGRAQVGLNVGRR